ncbi:MAG: hypothetical protein ABR555_18745 [Pyrinomonadaceae bacterium]
MIEEGQVRKQAQEIERLVREFETITDAELREKVVTLVQSLMALHAAGIERLVQIITEQEKSSRLIVDKLANDGLIAGLLVLYGLHPLSLEMRVERGLERLQFNPIIKSASLALIGISEGIVRLRVQNQSSCHSSKQALRTAVEEALYEAAPDVTEIQFVEEAQKESAVSFVPLISLRGKDGFKSTLNRPLPKT